MSPLQVQICKRSVEVMDAVRRGAQLAIDECQFQFRNRRWNCSTLETMPVFGKVVTQGKSVDRHRPDPDGSQYTKSTFYTLNPVSSVSQSTLYASIIK